MPRIVKITKGETKLLQSKQPFTKLYKKIIKLENAQELEDLKNLLSEVNVKNSSHEMVIVDIPICQFNDFIEGAKATEDGLSEIYKNNSTKIALERGDGFKNYLIPGEINHKFDFYFPDSNKQTEMAALDEYFYENGLPLQKFAISLFDEKGLREKITYEPLEQRAVLIFKHHNQHKVPPTAEELLEFQNTFLTILDYLLIFNKKPYLATETLYKHFMALDLRK